jgi:hypothetical protein
MGATMKALNKEERHEISAGMCSELLMDWKRDGD